MQSIYHTATQTYKQDFKRDIIFAINQPQLEKRAQTALYGTSIKPSDAFNYRVNNDVRKHMKRLQSSILPITNLNKQAYLRIPENRLKFYVAEQEQIRPSTQQIAYRPKTQQSLRRPQTSLKTLTLSNTKVRFNSTTQALTEDWRKLTKIVLESKTTLENFPSQDQAVYNSPDKLISLDLQTNELTEGEKLYIQQKRALFFENIKPYIKSNTFTKKSLKMITREGQNSLLSESDSDNESALLNNLK